MGADRNEHEPDEYDPEAEFRDPNSDSITIPEVSTENAGSSLRSDLESEMEADAEATPEFSTGETDVPPDLLKQFWALVLVLNAAILAIALGLLFLVFEGATYGYYILAVGLVFAGFTIHRYRTVKETEYDSGDETDDNESADETDDDASDGDNESDDEPRDNSDGATPDADNSLEGNTNIGNDGTNTAATDGTNTAATDDTPSDGPETT